MKRVTQTMIAKALGLAPSTVGLVVGACETRTTKKLRPETIEAIKAKAEEMGYFGPDRRARSMRAGRSNLIGIIHFGSPFETGQRSAFYLPQAVNALGYDYLVLDLHWHGGNTARVMNEIIESRVEGVLLTADYEEAFSREDLAVLQKAGIPVVSLYGDDELPVPRVGDAARSSFRALATHLLGLGHKKILFPCIPSDKLSSLGRIAGLREALPSQGEWSEVSEETFLSGGGIALSKKRNTPAITVVRLASSPHGENYTEANFRFASQLFAQGTQVDALIAFNDRAAMGIYNAAYSRGIRIPDDVALTGADDDAFGRYPMFELTTIRQDIERSCEAALKMLVTRIKNPKAKVKNVEFPSELIVRKSCGSLVARAAVL